MATPLAYLPKIRSDKVRRAARGMPCALRLPGVCNGDDETTVLAHVRGIGLGMSTKECDLNSVFACHACHDAIDARAGKVDRVAVLEATLRGMAETRARLIEAGLIQSPGAKVVS